METTGYHACSRLGGTEKVRVNGPFLAVHKPEQGKQQFLGQGYYFWDGNPELARVWGKTHYKGEYFIILAKILIDSESCFDLVGCTKHMNLLRKLLIDLDSKGKSRENWTISQLIQYLKNLAKLDNSIFPFEAIRAVDHVQLPTILDEQIPFVEHNKHFTVLNPKIAICLINKESVLLRSKKLVDPKTSN